MKTRTLVIVSAVVVAGLMLCGFTWAVEKAATTPGSRLANSALGRLITGHIGRALVLKSEMNVTDEQRAKVRETLAPHRAEIAAAARDLVAKKRALEDAVRADKTDEQAIRAAASNLGKSIGDASVLAAKVRAELAPVFTDEQKRLLEKFRADTRGAVDKWLGEMAQEPVPVQ